MVITDKFVYIHKPKTGGSFVTDALLKLYGGKWNRWQHLKLATLKMVQFKNDLGTLILTADKHGGCRNIPKSQLQKFIVTTVRNPFDYYVSQYEFGWWKRPQWKQWYQRFPAFKNYEAQFPNLSFSEFMELLTMAFNPTPHQNFHNPNALGRATIELLDDCFYEPAAVRGKLNSDYIESGAYKADMFPVQFLFTHGLNAHLHNYLLQQGYPPERIAFIQNKEKVLPGGKGRSKAQRWESYYTPELKALVRKKDWALFDLFPEFDITNSTLSSSTSQHML